MPELTQAQKVANALIEAKGMAYGPRHGDPRQHKGSGFYGPQLRTDKSGQTSTELSGSMTKDGPEFPLIYQGIPEQDLARLLAGQATTQDDYTRAAAAAQGRESVGLPAFALEGEQSPRSQIGMPPPRYGVQPTALQANIDRQMNQKRWFDEFIGRK